MANMAQFNGILSIFLLSISTNQIYCCFLGHSKIMDQAKFGFLYGDYQKKVSRVLHKVQTAEWNYKVNITSENLSERLSAIQEAAADYLEQVSALQEIHTSSISQPVFQRLINRMLLVGDGVLPETKLSKLERIKSQMMHEYNTKEYCAFEHPDKCGLDKQTETAETFRNSKDLEILKTTWTKFSDHIDHEIRQHFSRYIKLKNEAAVLNGADDAGQLYLSRYETDEDIINTINDVWEEIKPFYLQLFVYLRRMVRENFGDIVTKKGTLPIHLKFLLKSYVPYPVEPAPLANLNYTAEEVISTAQDFFVSMDLPELPKTFWNLSIFETPNNTKTDCSPDAWDFFDGEDYRIVICIKSQEDLYEAHKVMAQLKYLMQFKEQPIPFRRAPNNAFQNAIGGAVELSARSFQHLKKLYFMEPQDDTEETELNALFQFAVEKILSLASFYSMDMWRNDVFSGNIGPEEYNCRWWELKAKYEGFTPSVARSEKNFDPASMFYVIRDTPLMSSFVATVVEFQVYRNLCLKSGGYEPNNPRKPLHQCDFYESMEVGNILKDVLKLGSSQPWPEVLELATGQRTLNAAPLLEYFHPLQKWLESENKKSGEYMDWEMFEAICE